MLRATRYSDEKLPAPVRRILEHRDHLYFSYDKAHRFYQKYVRKLDNKGKALLGCNDRFFLLVFLLGRKDADNEWLYYRCREVELDPDGYLDLWARYHYKSTIITFAGIIQELLTDPNLTVGIFSVTAKIATKFLEQIKREFESNYKLARLYADVIWDNPTKEAPKWSVGEGIILKRTSNPKEPSVGAHGLVDGMPTGSHYGLLVYDDVVTPESVTTPEMIKKTTEMWELSDNLGVGEKTRKWHIGTRYSFGDTYGVILGRNILKVRLYPATHNGKLEGRPVFLSMEHWEKTKNTQRSTVAAQMLQNPLGGKEQTFDPRTFRAYEVRPSILNVYIMGDPSKGSSATSDRTAIAVVGIDIHGNKYLLDGFRHRMSLSESWQALKSLYLKWTMTPGVQMVRVGWERYGMQRDIEIFTEYQRNEQIAFEIKELAWPQQGQHSKKSRVERLEPDMRNGKFFFPAIIHEDIKGDQLWSVDPDKSMILKRPLPNGRKTRNMEKMIAAGQGHRCAHPIRRLDEDKKQYDLTSALIEEMLFFPFAPKDDLVDATSRIYDMDPISPSMWEDQIAEDINSEAFEDS